MRILVGILFALGSVGNNENGKKGAKFYISAAQPLSETPGTLLGGIIARQPTK